ncbi:MAG: TVP38/TMEM64 family protein [Deltaproteobacteria bacterium]|nr:TVP38/TMEM64 family protein [Deltaproteobacteria bacterium]
MTKRFGFKLAVFAALAAIYAVAALVPGVREFFSIESVRAQYDTLYAWAHEPWGPVAFVAVSLAIIFLQLPGLIMVIVGALVYSPLAAFTLATLTSIAGTTGTFFLFRYLLNEWAQPRLASSFLAPHVNRFERHGVWWMIGLRIAFALSSPLNWIIGATKIRTGAYFVGNAVGLAIVIGAVQAIVVMMKSWTGDSPIVSRGAIAALVAGLALFVAAAVWFRRRFAARSTQLTITPPRNPRPPARPSSSA